MADKRKIGAAWAEIALAAASAAISLWPKAAAKPKPDGPQFESGAPKVEGLKAAADAAKQLITLDVAMIGLTVTFLEKIIQPTANGTRIVSWQLAIAWIAYVFSLIGGMGTLLGVSGTLTTLDRIAMRLPIDADRDNVYDVYSPTVRIPMLMMVIGFLLAIGFTVAAAWFPPTGSAPPSPPPPAVAPAKAGLLQKHGQATHITHITVTRYQLHTYPLGYLGNSSRVT